MIGAGSLELDPKRTHTVQVDRDGYARRTVNVETSMNPWLWGNLILGPFFFVGIFVDAVSGAANRFSPEEVTIDLEPMPETKTEAIAEARPMIEPEVKPIAEARPAIELPSAPIAEAAPLTIADRAAAVHQELRREEAPVSIAMNDKTIATAAQRSWVVAVMNMPSGEEMKESLTLALSDQMRVFLAVRRVRVIDRGAQEAAFRAMVEEEKQRSYGSCIDETCQIPLGKALAATHILRAGLGRFGQTCTTNGELIDLRSEVTIAAGSTRSDCSEEGLLDAIEKLSDELIRGSAGQ